MEAHGEFAIELEGNFVHTYPEGGFNQEGIENIHKAILKAAPKSTAWGLYEHPKSESGLTPEAVEAILRFYNTLAGANCLIICMEVDAIWEEHVIRLMEDNVNIPVYVNPSEADFLSLASSNGL